MKWYFTAFIFIQSLIFNKIEAFENLARRGTAKQSSNYLSYDASKALDGDINQNWDGGSCSHTAVNRRTAWWRLDIGQQANIYNIVIYYRKLRHARLDGFYIHISDTFDEQHPNSGHLCFHDQQDGYANTLQNITCDYHGRYVVIYNQRNSTDAFLELCEVEVYGCILGMYGNACTDSCSTHCNGTTCDIKIGHCVCAPGYRGQKCMKIPPQTPANLTLVSSTETSILVEWTPGYSGDHEQTFYLEYRARRTETWSLKEISHNTKQLTTLTYVLSGLQDSTLYELKMYSKNMFGRSLSTDTDIIQTREKQDKVIQETSSSGFYAVIGGMAGAMTVLIITVIILGTLLFRRSKGWSGGTRNEISNRSDNNDEMSSLNRRTNDMYKDIREGTSDTRNEDLQQKGGNTSTATYEILAMQDIPNTSGGLSSEQEQRQSESTTEQYETLGEQDKTNVYEEIKNKQEPEDRSLSTLS